MKIEANGEEKITVTLSHEDMHRLDITYDEMDYSNIETRRVIWTVLDEAKRVLGKPINTDGRLLIQVSPADDGGCLMLFTQMPLLESKSKKRLIMKKDCEPILFEPFDKNAFLDCIKILKSLKNSIKAVDLFKLFDNYFAVIYPKPAFSETIEFCLGEYGDSDTSNKKGIARLYEYGKKLYLKEEIAPSVSEAPKI